MNTAIIVAAGAGNRFGGGRPKQFTELLGRPVLVHTLERFEHNPHIGNIVLVLSRDEIGRFEDTLRGFEIRKLRQIVAGGSSRAESVREGLDAVSGTDDGVVAVHDGARPIIPQDDISRTIRAVSETGAACLVAKLTDTVKEVRKGYIERTIKRNTLRRALTPQCFRFDVLKTAYDAPDFDHEATDDSLLVERSGCRVAFVEGSPLNIKITFKEDLAVAEVNLKILLEDEG